MPMGIVVISCVRPSVQPSMGLGLCIVYKALGRNGLQFGMLMYPDGLHSAFMDAYGYCCWSVCPSICPFVRLQHFQVAVHLLTNHLEQMAYNLTWCSHYWEMAVAITCGYGGYLLPLLAAHSSIFTEIICGEFMKFPSCSFPRLFMLNWCYIVLFLFWYALLIAKCGMIVWWIVENRKGSTPLSIGNGKWCRTFSVLTSPSSSHAICSSYLQQFVNELIVVNEAINYNYRGQLTTGVTY